MMSKMLVAVALAAAALSQEAMANQGLRHRHGHHHRHGHGHEHAGTFGARAVAVGEAGGDSGFLAEPSLGFRFKHRLRVCNAYPSPMSLDVYKGDDKLTKGSSLAYRDCREFRVPMQSGDRLDFKAGGASAGTFTVSDLPATDAVLFLAIHRHDTLSTAVSFESHVFANLLNAQIAVIDTFKGRAAGVPRISDDSGKTARSEQLRFNSVVAVNPGNYEVELDDHGEARSLKHLVALNRESYVVMRVGVDAQQGDSFPQELVVFPNPGSAMLRSRSASPRSTPCALAQLFAALFTLVAVVSA